MLPTPRGSRDRAGGPRRRPILGGGTSMLQTIAIILLVLWLLGLITGTTLGGFIYALLVIAIALFLIGLLTGRRGV